MEWYVGDAPLKLVGVYEVNCINRNPDLEMCTPAVFLMSHLLGVHHLVRIAFCSFHEAVVGVALLASNSFSYCVRGSARFSYCGRGSARFSYCVHGFARFKKLNGSETLRQFGLTFECTFLSPTLDPRMVLLMDQNRHKVRLIGDVSGEGGSR